MNNPFSNILKGKVVIIGMGNLLRADDNFGPAFVEQLKDSTKMTCFDVGTAPENYTGKIIKEKPDTILLVDAVELGLESGDYAILDSAEILKSGFSTHDLSPKMFLDYLKAETNADIYLLGIQPQRFSLGEEMSDCLKDTLTKLIKLIGEADYARDTSDSANH